MSMGQCNLQVQQVALESENNSYTCKLQFCKSFLQLTPGQVFSAITHQI